MVGKIKSKEEVAVGTLRVEFEVKEPFSFKPGQYCVINLGTLQYPDPRGPRRQFSINNSPNQKGLIVITTRISESGLKQTLKGLPIGSQVELGPIGGVFTLPDDTEKPLVMIAGGIGITPFLSMLAYITEQKLPYKVTLVYSNRNKESTAYLKELQNYQLQTTNYQLILTMTDDPTWTGEKRMVNAEFIKSYFPQVNDQSYMVVGPPKMVEAVEKALLEAGVTVDNIRKENFTGY